MKGTISYLNESRRFALLTPVGAKRDLDVFCHLIQFDIADIEPLFGLTVQFAVGTDANGKCEARDVQLLPPIVEPGVKRDGSNDCGAFVGGRGNSPPAAAGNDVEAR